MALRPAFIKVLTRIVAPCVIAFGQPSMLMAQAEPASIDWATDVVRIAPPGSFSDFGSQRMESVSFTAFSRQFRLNLTSNGRLKSGLSPREQARLGGIRLYSGSIDGYQQSWVRLTEFKNDLSGGMYDGAELFVIDTVDGRIRIVRADEASLLRPRSFVGDSVANVLVTGDASKPFVAPTASQKLMLPVDPGQTIEIGLVADSAFDADRAPNTEADLLANANFVDGIFLWQLGVQISIAEIVVLDSASDPFTDADRIDFLNELSAFKTNSAELAPLGLVHLFTGREILSDDPDSRLAGVATFGTVCDTGFGVGITRRDRGYEGLVAAHEIGHNFGAPHDNEEGSACEAEPTGFLMENTVNGSETFSQCSIDEMLPYVNAGPCFQPWLDSDLSLRVERASEILYPADTGFLEFAIDASANGSANAVEVRVQAFGPIDISELRESNISGVGFQCDPDGFEWVCLVNYLPAASSTEMRVDFSTNDIGTAGLLVTVNSSNDPNPDNDTLTYRFAIGESVDMVTEIEVLPGESQVDGDLVFYPGDQGSGRAVVRNQSDSVALDATVSIGHSFTIAEMTVTSPDVVCVNIVSRRFDCDLGDMAPNSEIEFDLSFTIFEGLAEDVERITASMSANADSSVHDSRNGNDHSSVTLLITRSIFDLDLGADVVDPMPIGEVSELLITLTNHGPDPATDVELGTDHIVLFPEELSFVSVTSNLGDCLIDETRSDEIDCHIERLAAGETVEVRVEVQVTGEFNLPIVPAYSAFGYEIDRPSGFPWVQLVARADEPDPPADPPEDPPEDPPIDPPDDPPVSNPPPPSAPSNTGSGGGGGGSFDWPSVLLLLGGSLLGRAQKKRRRQAPVSFDRRPNPLLLHAYDT